MTEPRTLAARSELVEEISDYLAKRPNAGDTAAGIWRYWLTTTRDKSDVQSVEEALDSLVVAGKLCARLLAGGEQFYFAPGSNGFDAEDGDR